MCRASARRSSFGRLCQAGRLLGGGVVSSGLLANLVNNIFQDLPVNTILSL